jgi:hypothetical protein
MLDCLKIKNVGMGECVGMEREMFLVVEGDYEIVKGKDVGRIVKGCNDEKRLFGSMVGDLKEEIKFVTVGKIAWTTQK